MRPTKYEAQTRRKDDMTSKMSQLERPSFDTQFVRHGQPGTLDVTAGN